MRVVTTMPETTFREVTHQLQSNVAGVQGIVLIGPDGMMDHLAVERSFDPDVIASEYAMLLRIARRTSEDIGAGDLIEHVTVSEETVAVARRFASDFYLVVVSNLQDQIGRARYELRRAAWYLERTMR